MKKVTKIILLSVSLLITLLLVLAFSVLLIGKQATQKDFSQCVYLQSSKTKFNDDNTITVTFNNVSNEKFEDVVIHLIYVNPDNKPVGYAYSEQKIITFDAEKEMTLTFENPGWVYSSYNEIKAAKKNGTSSWTTLQTGREFENPFDIVKSVSIGAGVAIFVFAVLDILLIVSLRKDKKMVQLSK